MNYIDVILSASLHITSGCIISFVPTFLPTKEEHIKFTGICNTAAVQYLRLDYC